MATSVKKLTTADYEKMPEDGFRHEILRGAEFMTPPPGTAHQTGVVQLTRILGDHIADHQLGQLFVAPTAVILSKHDAVEPDVFFVSKARFLRFLSKGLDNSSPG